MGTGQVIAAAGTGVAAASAAGYALIQRAGMPSDAEVNALITPTMDQPAPGIVFQGTGISRGWAWRDSGRAIYSDSEMHRLALDRGVHAGLDIVGPMDTPVFSARSGIVLWARPKRGYGNMVVVKHRDGLTTLYAHLNSISVHPGQIVRGGTMVGTLGQSSDARGGRTHFPDMPPHVHFSVHRGAPVANFGSAMERRYGTEPLRWLGSQGSRAIHQQIARG